MTTENIHLNNVQETLEDGINIKTVNGNTLLGSGDLEIPIPTKTSELTNDAGFVTTDTTYSAGLGLREVGTEFSQDFVIDGSGDVIDVEQTADGIKVTKGQINYNGLANLPDLSALSNISTHPTQSNFPVTGKNNTVYIAEDTGYMYRWNGTGYTQLTDQTAIWGDISGDILNQIDLVNTLALKEDKSNKKNNLSTPNNTDYPTTQAVTDYVGNGELDIQLNGVSLRKFNANQVSNAIANIIAQEPLVSGTNIKTVGGQSLLGSGNIPFPIGLQLGETSSTAYRGDRGKTAYDHSQLTTGNPHNVTKTDVGLGNVDNTSDADKPISTATQTALNGKVDSVTAGFGARVDNTDPKNPIINVQRHLPVLDTRNDNEPPLYYLQSFRAQAVTYEFKRISTIGVGSIFTSGTYCSLETISQFVDASGGYPFQTARNPADGKMAKRYGINDTTWSPWEEI